jgi:hypothetical protein
MLPTSCVRKKAAVGDFAESAAHHNVDGLPENLNDN